MVKKNNKIKQGNTVSEDVAQVRTLIIIFIIVFMVSVGIYFLTDVMIKKESLSSNEIKEVEIDYDIATIGTMFNRIENEYYVLLYSNEEDGSKLNRVLDSYRSSDDYIKTYYVDLDKKINSIALGDKLVEEPKNSNEVKVTGPTLYKIKDGKVTDCLSGTEKIINKLED